MLINLIPREIWLKGSLSAMQSQMEKNIPRKQGTYFGDLRSFPDANGIKLSSCFLHFVYTVCTSVVPLT